MKRPVSFVILILFCGFSWAEKKPLSLHDLTKVRQVISVAMSPDGENIAFTLTKPRDVFQDGDGESWRELYVVDKRGTIRPFITGTNAIGQLKWSNDGKQLWFLAKRPSDTFVGIYVMPMDGGESRRAISHEHDIVGFSLDDSEQKILFWGIDKRDPTHEEMQQKGFDAEVYDESAPFNKLWMVDFDNTAQPISMIYDKTHVIQAAFQPEGQLIAIQSAPSPLQDDKTMAKKLGLFDYSGAVKQQFQHQGKMGKFRWSPDGKHIAIIGTNDPHDPAEGRLLIGNVNTTSLTNLLPDLKGHVEDIDWMTDTKIGFVVHQGLETYLASKRLKNSSSMKKLANKLDVITKMSSSKGGKQLALVVSSPAHSKEIYWHNERASRRITDSNLWLKERQLGRQREVSFFARDGIKIEGILVSPAEKSEKPRPLIIFVHGGPESHISNGWLNRYSHPAHVAAGQGYISYFPNYRGSTGRGVKFTKAGQNDYAGAEFTDILDAKFHLVKMGLADPDRTGITGASYGGYASAWAATVFSEHFAASVATMAIGNQISKFGTTDIPTEMYQLHALQWPWEDWQWMLERSPVFHSEKLNTPLLLMHGEQDKRVHPSQSIELYRYAKLRGNAPVRLVLYPQEGHGFRRTASKYDYSLRLMRWMDTFLSDDPQGVPPYNLPQSHFRPNSHNK